MNKAVIAIFILASAATGAAQPSAPLALDAFLEQRVPDELAADGTLLSRLGVALDVELVGDRWLVSLVDSLTRRVVASTKVDSLPTDREAAAAAITQVTAGLVSQLGGRVGGTGDLLTGPGEPGPVSLGETIRIRDDAEFRYRQEMVTFEQGLGVTTVGVPGKNQQVTSYTYTQPVKGELKKPIGGRDFYLAVDRPDLAEQYSRRKRRGRIGVLAAPVLGVVGVGIVVIANSRGASCDGAPDFNDCVDAKNARNAPFVLGGAAITLAGVVSLIGGIYYLVRPHPVDSSEWYDLAQTHNANLRRKYGLSVGVAPYASAEGGGLSLAGRF